MTSPTRTKKHAAVTLFVAGCLLALTGGMLSGARALAVFNDITETGTPGLLRLAVHDETPLWVTLGPGGSAKWLVQASLDGAESGTLAVELDAYGELVSASGITARVDACTEHFDPAHLDLDPENVPCSGLSSTVLPVTALSALAVSDDRYGLADLHRLAPRELLVTLTIPATADPEVIANEIAHIGFGVHASGEAEDSNSGGGESDNHPGTTGGFGGGLAATGADVLSLGVLALGLAAIVTGIALMRRTPATTGAQVAVSAVKER